MLKNTNQNRQSNIISIFDNDIFEISRQRVLSTTNTGASVIIPHVCNNINLFGAGFAAAVANKYPDVKTNFHLLGNKAKLGNVQFVTTEKNKNHRRDLVFANMIAQNKTINHTNPRPLNYEALVSCMATVRKFAHSLLDNEHDKIEIHCPKFGCGLAGGNWSFVSNLISDIWSEFDVFVYIPKSNK
jgi:hypothetical protein